MLNSIKYDLWVKEIGNEIRVELKSTSSVAVSHGVHSPMWALLSAGNLNSHMNLISPFPARSTFRQDVLFVHSPKKTISGYSLECTWRGWCLNHSSNNKDIVTERHWPFAFWREMLAAVQVTDLRTTPGWDATWWRSRHDVRWPEPATAPHRCAAWRRRREQQIRRLMRFAAHSNLNIDRRGNTVTCRQRKNTKFTSSQWKHSITFTYRPQIQHLHRIMVLSLWSMC